MAGVLSMLRDVYLFSKSCCHTTQNYVGQIKIPFGPASTSVWVSHVLSNNSHVCMVVCGDVSGAWLCLLTFLVSSPSSMCLDALLLCWYCSLFLQDERRSWHIWYMLPFFAFTSLQILYSQQQPAFLSSVVPIFIYIKHDLERWIFSIYDKSYWWSYFQGYNKYLPNYSIIKIMLFEMLNFGGYIFVQNADKNFLKMSWTDSIFK